ncbi:hypothetical protein Tco_0956841 [Tanacetum coccineum]
MDIKLLSAPESNNNLHDIQLSLVVDYFPRGLALSFRQFMVSAYLLLQRSQHHKLLSAFASVLLKLMNVVAIVGVGVTVVVVAAGDVVESSSVIKLSFVAGHVHSTMTRHRQLECHFPIYLTGVSSRTGVPLFMNKHCYEGDEDENDAYDDDE